MSRSLQSDIKKRMPPPGSRPEKVVPAARRRRKKSSYLKRTLAFALLSFFVLGCLSLASLSAFWALIRSGGVIDGPTQPAGGLFAQSTPPDPARYMMEPPPLAGLLPLQDAPTPTSFPLPQATLPPEPTPLATQAVVYLPTPTKTPTPVPTEPPIATSPPADVPTPVPPTEAPAQAVIDHVVIISIDGLRPDVLDVADTPMLDSLRANGAYSPNAKTVLPSETMPSHASMLGGMTPDKHGIIWNLPYEGAPRVNGPTLFSVAHEAGLSTAMVVGKDKLEYLVLPNSVDQFIYAGSTDGEVKNRAIAVIQAGLPRILFIHFPNVDVVGHAVGWMSPDQLQTLVSTDGLIGEVVASLKAGGYLDRTLLIVTADHGGSGTTHGADTPESTTIPWLAVGPGVPAGVTLTAGIHTYDTAATVLYALKLPVPETWAGQPVMEIFTE